MSRTEHALLLARTVRHLQPAQVVHRVRLRGQKTLVQAAPGAARRLLARAVPTDVGWPPDFVPVDARLLPLWPALELIDENRITLLGHERPLEDWRSREPPQLWRYHLHYWDWAWSLALAEDGDRGRRVFQRHFRSWQQQSRFGEWDEWSPYVVALRAWSWCGQYDRLVRGAAFEREFVELLGLHQGFLRAHLELDVGGNHLIKNLKGLIGLAVFFRDARALRRALRLLEREVWRQVLPDGGHYERAPAYHCQVLADLADLEGLLGEAAPAWLTDAVLRMRRWLGLVLLPDGTVPLLNDGFPVEQALLEVLQPGPAAGEGLTMLASTGLAVVRRGPWFLLADGGEACPDELPAHAHADTLGFLLYDGAAPVVVEAFTSTYEPGPVRVSERGTAGHSTVQVDRADSTETWGAFRAARRARVLLREAMDDPERTTLTASHDGYARLRGCPVHERTWSLDAVSVTIQDLVDGRGVHEVVARLHLSDERAVEWSAPHRREDQPRAAGWNDVHFGRVDVCEVNARLPVRVTARILAGVL